MAAWVGYKGGTKKQAKKQNDIGSMLAELTAAGFQVKGGK
jgi:hypothetical protein